MPLRRPLVVNQSTWKNYDNCKRLYAWKQMERLAPQGKRSALEIGTATHRGLAEFHGGADAATSLQVALDYLTESAGPTSSFADKDLVEASELVSRLLPAYFEHWGERGEIWTPLGQEIEFCVEVGEGTQNFLRGKSDNLSTYKDGLYIVDYKTTGRNDPRDSLKYEMDCQLSSYIYGLSKHLTIEALARGGEPVFIRGAIIDFLIKTKIPQFNREFFTRTIEELLEFEEDFNEFCDELRMKQDRVAAGESWKKVFRKTTEHCFRFGTCAYRDVCLKDTPVRRALYDKKDNDYVDEAQEKLNIVWMETQSQ
jgi:hypothetical protein